MKKIVSVIKPFTMQQNIFVYEDGNKIDALTANLDNIQEILLDTAMKYNANEIQLVGAKNYSKGIKNKIEELEISKYNENKIIIDLINS